MGQPLYTRIEAIELACYNYHNGKREMHVPRSVQRGEREYADNVLSL